MKHLIVIISLLTLSLSAAAEQVDSLALTIQSDVEVVEEPVVEAEVGVAALWDRANTAYINASYNNAIEIYHSIEEMGLSSDKLYFNLGNAYYKIDDIARAILYYQKALLISPNDGDILYNLSVAQSQIKDQIEAIPEFFLRSWSRSIGRIFDCMGWSIISLVALAIVLTSLLMFLLSPEIVIRKIGFGVGLSAVIIFTIATLYALDDRREQLDHNKAVIMSQSISIKSSPDRSATDLFMLHSGTTVKILREIDGWYEIVITDGKKGWIENQRVEII
ncbi:MAG: tetratricopeptide repeat protein [Rikenellaceae bacterium]